MNSPRPGALVISIDFELHWGVRDWRSSGAFREEVMATRAAIPRMLELFDRYGVAATWATVGFLFCESRRELLEYAPRIRPGYATKGLSPYDEPLGDGERDDPLHFAPSLVGRIRSTPRQEIATHTFSHYYCLERGQSEETFEADLASAMDVARGWDVELRSIVFPRGHVNPAYTGALKRAGISCYRGNQPTGPYRIAADGSETTTQRATRLADTYLGPIRRITRWDDVRQPDGLCNVPTTLFLRPYAQRWRYLEPLRRARAVRLIRGAAETGGICHLWWHCHNYGARTEENLEALEVILAAFARHRDSHGMQSLSMDDVARVALTGADR